MVYRVFHRLGLLCFAVILLFGKLGWNPLFGMCAGSVLLAAAILRRKPSFRLCILGTAFCIAGFSLLLWQLTRLEPARAYQGKTITVWGAVLETERFSSSNLRADLQLLQYHAPNGLAGKRLRLFAYDTLDVEVGDVVQCSIKLDATTDTALYAKGLHLSGTGSILRIQDGGADALLSVRLAHYRTRLSHHITYWLPGDEGQALAGMLLGNSQQIPRQIRSDYARTGISHLLAVSGLHLATLAALFELLVSRLLSRRERAVFILLFTIAFMALTGFSPSVTRAGIMLIILQGACLLGRDPDSLNALGLAVLLLLVQNPYAAFGISLQLSYLATLGILLFSRPFASWTIQRIGADPFTLREQHPLTFQLIESVMLTLSASVLTAPLLCWQFGKISLVSPIVNLMVAPLAAIALPAGLLCGFFGFFPQFALLAQLCGLAGGLAVKGIHQIAAWWALTPHACLAITEAWFLLWWAGALAIGILLWQLHADTAQRRYAALLLTVVLLGSANLREWLFRDSLQIAVSRYGGTVAFAYSTQGAVLGTPSSVPAAEQLCDFLEDSGVVQIDLLVAQTQDALYSDAVRQLAKRMPVTHALALEDCHGFQAELFGWVELSAVGSHPDRISVQIGNLQLEKIFHPQTVQADLLVNHRGELITAPNCHPAIDHRLYRSDRFKIRRTNREGRRSNDAIHDRE
ncbi:MAG: ComEC family competence protein [Anaerotruncus sp.]|nr:ComEC family competence protein [Anaerotruncus sp.]